MHPLFKGIVDHLPPPPVDTGFFLVFYFFLFIFYFISFLFYFILYFFSNFSTVWSCKGIIIYFFPPPNYIFNNSYCYFYSLISFSLSLFLLSLSSLSLLSFSPQKESNFGMLVSLLEHEDHLGRVVVGTIRSGELQSGDVIAAIDREGRVVEEGKVLLLFFYYYLFIYYLFIIYYLLFIYYFDFLDYFSFFISFYFSLFSFYSTISKKKQVTKISVRKGLNRTFVTSATAGDIVGIAGLSSANVTDTIRIVPKEKEKKERKEDWAVVIPSDPLDPPVLSISVRVNDSPLSGREFCAFFFFFFVLFYFVLFISFFCFFYFILFYFILFYFLLKIIFLKHRGKKCTSRNIDERLKKELETNVSLQVKKVSESCFEVFFFKQN